MSRAYEMRLYDGQYWRLLHDQRHRIDLDLETPGSGWESAIAARLPGLLRQARDQGETPRAPRIVLYLWGTSQYVMDWAPPC